MLDYLRIARVDHWIKNVFVLPGIAFAFFADPEQISASAAIGALLALVATCLAASSNYVINEILDAPRDRFHPDKSSRPIASGRVSLPLAYLEWIVLGAASLALAFYVNVYVGFAVLSLLVMGLMYNVPPVRTKDLPYLDAVSEAVNNPIRLLIGWYATGTELFPPISLLLAYWAIGAFFMTIKRLAEFRYINDAERAAKYRKSFKYYSETSLLATVFFHATNCALFAGVFMIRYHLELVLSAPAFALFMASYLIIGLQKDSPAQHPERLLKSPLILVATLLLTVSVLGSLAIDSPGLREMFHPTIPPQLPVED